MPITTTDRAEISDLVARYNKAIDTGDADGWAATFTKDGEFHGVIGDFCGTDELRGMVADYTSNPELAEFASAQHWVTNLVVDGEGDEAEMFAHLMMVAPAEGGGAGGGRIILVGHYEDTLRRVDGRWLFSKRTVHV
jgi:uncharacterized protein (TIGR02246 family)